MSFVVPKLHEFCDVYDFLTVPFAEVSLRTWHQANYTAVSMISPPPPTHLPWFDHIGESSPYKEDEFKTFCPSVKKSCPPAENIIENPALRLCHNNFNLEFQDYFFPYGVIYCKLLFFLLRISLVYGQGI